jgi:hypothetical protein
MQRASGAPEVDGNSNRSAGEPQILRSEVSKDTPISDRTLFDVLHLFAHLLDDHFHLDSGARGLQVLRL